jgi:hypothetical protein
MIVVSSHFCAWLIASVLSWTIGYLVVALLVKLVRITVAELRGEPIFEWLVFWVGGVERTAAITLAFCAPNQLATFIGGWTVLKFAAGWQREPNDKSGVKSGSLVALIGSVLSFGFAMLSVWLVYPEIISVIGKIK